jgi:hypothetical protein
VTLKRAAVDGLILRRDAPLAVRTGDMRGAADSAIAEGEDRAGAIEREDGSGLLFGFEQPVGRLELFEPDPALCAAWWTGPATIERGQSLPLPATVLVAYEGGAEDASRELFGTVLLKARSMRREARRKADEA